MLPHSCHPAIAEVANVCFYSSRLLHGCVPEQRPPLLPGLPPLLWLDVMGQEEGGGGRGGGSLCNPQEATAAAGFLKALVQEAGIAVGRCGVIACYKRQVACVQQALQGGGTASGVQVATVDSFQVRGVCSKPCLDVLATDSQHCLLNTLRACTNVATSVCAFLGAA